MHRLRRQQPEVVAQAASITYSIGRALRSLSTSTVFVYSDHLLGCECAPGRLVQRDMGREGPASSTCRERLGRPRGVSGSRVSGYLIGRERRRVCDLIVHHKDSSSLFQHLSHEAPSWAFFAGRTMQRRPQCTTFPISLSLHYSDVVIHQCLCALLRESIP